MKNLTFILVLSLFTFGAFAQTTNYQLSSHILDISKGAPAAGVTIQLNKLNVSNKQWSEIDSKITDQNGRIGSFLEGSKNNEGIYKLTFLVSDYFKQKNTESFYPFIDVVFEIKDNQHYHVPITLSEFGYATYRGN